MFCSIKRYSTVHESHDSRLTTHELYNEARKWRPILGENAARVSAAAAQAAETARGHGPNDCSPRRATSHGMLNFACKRAVGKLLLAVTWKP
jgi:hypothetical protein